MRLIVDRCIFMRAFIRRGLFGRVRFQRNRFLGNLRIGTRLLTAPFSSVIDGRLPVLVSRIADRRSLTPVRSPAIDRRRPRPRDIFGARGSRVLALPRRGHGRCGRLLSATGAGSAPPPPKQVQRARARTSLKTSPAQETTPFSFLKSAWKTPEKRDIFAFL